ncbi:GT2 family glycosyltransferase [Leucobacter exalbidus]|uniref:GT2 family glycosyltransferase n=1 Tax=Leucobacter exalbidus TaxID=662960 RepID=A0A940T1P9_9MICO|nr:glycosyltransferase [Leucobacter exalbidus]MBP1327075.1 GT2 family glycosyltransferase [Leucobacter exalbidus]
MRTKVTAILVAQRGGTWLDETIAGIAAQRAAPAAIIAVNNGGGDALAAQLIGSGADRVVGISQRVSFGKAIAQAVAVAEGDRSGVRATSASGTAGSADTVVSDAGSSTSSLADGSDRSVGIEDVDSNSADLDSDNDSDDADTVLAATAESQTKAATSASPVATLAAEDTNPQHEWLWFLSEDSCPEPEALLSMLSRVQRAPSVVVAGPKIVDWDAPDRIIELGQSLTRYGARWTLRRQELDQQQYDHMEDVLGVGPVGMLVRRDVWEEMGGFDQALPVYDDGLDFCVRARLAGHRVEVAPEARVRFARSGVAGPRIDRSRSVMRVAHRQSRAAHMHRRIAYAPAPFAFLAWLGLPIHGLLRVLWALIREQPGHMIGEFVAALSVFFKPHALLSSRRKRKHSSRVGWGALRDLRIDPKSVRTARIIDREAVLASSGRLRRELHFISSGGLAVVTTAIVATIVLTWWALSKTSLVGGGLLPLSSFGELWWNTHIVDGIPADPFTWVLAVLGTLTFWNPSHAVVLLLVAAVPLAALGAWIWAAGLTESKSGRALVALGYAFSPVLLGSLASGRLPSLVLAIVLPWLILAASRSRESWSWAGTASLLAGVALAAAPTLIPAALVLLVAGLVISARGIARVLTTTIVPIVLFAPKLVMCIVEGRPLDVLIDPGVALAFEPGTTWHMLLSFPQFGLEGWGAILDGMGFGGPPATLLVGLMLAPIAVIALAGALTAQVKSTIFLALVGGMGMATALASDHLLLVVVGDQSVGLWTGSGLTVYWLAVLGLAGLGATALRRAAAPAVSLALIGAVIAILPLGAQLATGQVPFAAGSTQMPAIVRAAGEADPGVRTLMIAARAPHTVEAGFAVGGGQRLDQIRSAPAALGATDADREITALTAGLASEGGADMTETLRDAGVGFVLLEDGGNDVERAQLQRVFDQNPALAASSQTDQGLLWRVLDSKTAGEMPGDVSKRLDGTSISGHTIWVGQIAILLGMLLLALPTGEVTWRPEHRRRQPRAPKTRKRS